MPDPIVYLDGRFVPQAQATLPIDDRGALFGDGIYEVVRYFGHQPFAMQDHLDRLARNLRELHLDPLPCFDQLDSLSSQLLERNALPDATVYWQITRRGEKVGRDRRYPKALGHHVLMTAAPARSLTQEQTIRPVRCGLHPDLRWARCDIKSLSLLPSVLAHNHAVGQGYDDALLHRDDLITEATAANVFLIRNHTLHTHPANTHILPGIHRQRVIDLAQSLGIAVQETAFTLPALLAADSVFLTGTTTLVRPVQAVQSTAFPTDHPMLCQLRTALLSQIANQVQSRDDRQP